MNPPRWAEALLRLLLRERDRDAISGDLLEEYREEILPGKGPVRARLWYLRQIVSFISPAMIGLVLGAALGAANLIDTMRRPLADDDGGVILAWGAGVMLVWGVVGFGAAGRTERFCDAIKAGSVAGLATVAVFHVASIVRANVFLDSIRYRDDWQNLLARYQASDFVTLRTYANYEYIRVTPMVLAVGAIAGAIGGALGGAVSGAIRTSSSPSR